MPESVLALIANPVFSLAMLGVSAGVAAVACAALPFAMGAVRRRLDALDAAQAETAAFFASETRRLGAMIVQQRAERIGEALRQPTEANPSNHRRATPVRAEAEMPISYQPLRKTIH